MTDKKLEAQIKKMASVIKKQQALLNKFAQCLQGDPLCDTDGNILGDDKKAKPAPQPKPLPKPAKPDQNKADAVGMLPADLKAALDIAVPHLKGALNLELDGQTLNVRYNADLVKGGASKVQQALAAALANTGYSVLNCLGEMNPTWRPNFV